MLCSQNICIHYYYFNVPNTSNKLKYTCVTKYATLFSIVFHYCVLQRKVYTATEFMSCIVSSYLRHISLEVPLVDLYIWNSFLPLATKQFRGHRLHLCICNSRSNFKDTNTHTYFQGVMNYLTINLENVITCTLCTGGPSFDRVGYVVTRP